MRVAIFHVSRIDIIHKLWQDMKAAVELLYTTDNMFGVPDSFVSRRTNIISRNVFFLAHRNDNVNNESKDHPYPKHDC